MTTRSRTIAAFLISLGLTAVACQSSPERVEQQEDLPSAEEVARESGEAAQEATEADASGVLHESNFDGAPSRVSPSPDAGRPDATEDGDEADATRDTDTTPDAE